MMTREDLMKKTVKELREMAKESGVKGYSKLSKSELVLCLDVVTDIEDAMESIEIKEEEVTEEMKEEANVKEVNTEQQNVVEPEEVKVPVNRDQAMPLKIVKKMWNGKEKTRYTCPVCGVRIYNPDTDHFCFNCGQKLENVETK